MRFDRYRVTSLVNLVLLVGVLLPAQCATSIAVNLVTTPGNFGLVNQPVTVQAQTTNAVNPTFQFWVGDPTANYWTLLRDYASTSTITWTPTAAGVFPLVVRVRNAGSTQLYDVQNNVFFPINPIAAPITRLNIIVTPGASGLVNQAVSVTVQPTGGYNPVFQFWVGDPSATYWTLLQDYSSNNRISWTPTAVGAFPIVVRARNVDSSRLYDLQNNLYYPVNPATGSTAVGPLSITKYHGNKPAAISYTFDDGMQSQIDYGAPALDAFGFHGTFNVIAGFTRQLDTDPQVPVQNNIELKGSWQGWARLAAAGHEIGNHSYYHLDLPTLTDPLLIDREINGSAALILAKLKQSPFTFAYPYNDHNPYLDGWVLQHHQAIRLNMTQFGAGGISAVTDMNAAVDNAIKQGSWYVPQLHGFLPNEYGYLSPTLLQQHLSYVAARNDVWVESYGKVSRYQQERQQAQLELDALSASTLTFVLTCPLNAALFHDPLTIAITTGQQVTNATAQTANGATLATTIAAKTILIDVAAGSGAVTVKWQ